ncbi:hypothetical protein NGTWS0302_10980 [Mycolicibacterium cyprinidarum]|uniref:YNCE-like beta-propeller domain-containing protein n=1 Tax=Mycolicibacterium cyprinidarum TaxID=2860311 RepID=A0ABQ4V871_9MYCO|nr:hypothetical protein NGTWS1803_20550 [Mycolicibacterium sp. NGTWS1803]GJF13244.1 hypothetical protein NGTWS1702_13270 [Mycolicibacterium sp. NGTWSNA01]GJF16144.1 hypothetical protein NGTWS0302_10980 [Mycolicibacterium sp. NGTWS0302]
MKMRLAAATAVIVLGAALTACANDSNDSDSTDSPAPSSTTPASSQSARAGTGSVWVADQEGDSLTVIDADTNAVTTTVTGILHPHNVQVSRDGTTVYAVTGDNRVVAIDTTNYTVGAVAPTGPAPAHVIEAPNDKVYVTNADDGTVSVYQAAGLKPAGRIDLGGMPHGLRPAADGSVIVVANTVAGALDLIDPATDRPTGTIPVGDQPAQVAVSDDGRYAYAGVTDPPSVVKVDLGSRTVVGSTPVSAAPVQLYLTPDGTTVLSADQGTADNPGDTVSVIDTAAMAVRGAVGTGSGPHGVVIDTSGTRAWVTDTYDDTVSVIDLDSLAVVATVAVGAAPNGISYSSHPPAASGSATVALDIPAPSPDAAGPTEQQPPHQHGH